MNRSPRIIRSERGLIFYLYSANSPFFAHYFSLFTQCILGFLLPPFSSFRFLFSQFQFTYGFEIYFVRNTVKAGKTFKSLLCWDEEKKGQVLMDIISNEIRAIDTCPVKLISEPNVNCMGWNTKQFLLHILTVAIYIGFWNFFLLYYLIKASSNYKYNKYFKSRFGL